MREDLVYQNSFCENISKKFEDHCKQCKENLKSLKNIQVTLSDVNELNLEK